MFFFISVSIILNACRIFVYLQHERIHFFSFIYCYTSRYIFHLTSLATIFYFNEIDCLLVLASEWRKKKFRRVNVKSNWRKFSSKKVKLISFSRDTDKRNETRKKMRILLHDKRTLCTLRTQHLTGLQSVIHFSLFCQALLNVNHLIITFLAILNWKKENKKRRQVATRA